MCCAAPPQRRVVRARDHPLRGAQPAAAAFEDHVGANGESGAVVRATALQNPDIVQHFFAGIDHIAQYLNGAPYALARLRTMDQSCILDRDLHAPPVPLLPAPSQCLGPARPTPTIQRKITARTLQVQERYLLVAACAFFVFGLSPLTVDAERAYCTAGKCNLGSEVLGQSSSLFTSDSSLWPSRTFSGESDNSVPRYEGI
ncbi:hypothetical protein C8R44DRAFT_991401 [Mycena epipterygia]|nr:hypothetical protein C8R44DRAFT_991401 [Mycena epipterygia]